MSTKLAPIIAAVYARVSTSDQADRGYSLPTQIEACLAMAQQLGYSVPESHIFRDDYTGMSLNRPQLAKLRDLVHQRVIQAVIIYDMDRLSRKLAHQLLLNDELEDATIKLHVVTMPAGDNSPETQLLHQVKGAMAEYERLKIRERTTRGRRGRAKAGHVPYGRRTYGYKYIKDARGAHYEVHPDESKVVQRIFALYIAGNSMDAIAAQLTTEGIPTPKEEHRRLGARVWYQSTIRTILASETYAGTMYDGKTRNLPSKTDPDRKTRHEPLSPEHWIPVAVPALIFPEEWVQAQALRGQNRSFSRRNCQHPYLLIHSRLRCGQCGGAMTGELSPGRKPRYRCSRGKRPYLDVLAPHGQRSVLAEDVEPIVWQAVVEVLEHPERIAGEAAAQREQEEQGQNALNRERQYYGSQLTRITRESQKAWDAYAADAISLERFKAIEAELVTKRRYLETELAKVEEQVQALQHSAEVLDAIQAYCARVRGNLEELTIDERHLALDALQVTATWRPGELLAIKGRIPLGSNGQLSTIQSDERLDAGAASG
jgi:site-specific DNA recombinase